MSKIKYYTEDKLNRVSLLEIRSEARKVSDALVERDKGSIPLWSTKPKNVLIRDIQWGYNQLGYPNDSELIESEIEETPSTFVEPEISDVDDADFEDVEDPDFDYLYDENEDDEDLDTDTDEPDDFEESVEEVEEEISISSDTVIVDEPEEESIEEEELPSKAELVRNALLDGIEELDNLEEIVRNYYPDVKRGQISTYRSQQRKKLGL